MSKGWLWTRDRVGERDGFLTAAGADTVDVRRRAAPGADAGERRVPSQ